MMKLNLKTVLPEKTSLIIYQALDLKFEGNTSYFSPIQGIGLIESVRSFLKAISDFIKTRTFDQCMYESLHIMLLNKGNHLSEVLTTFEGSNRRKYQ